MSSERTARLPAPWLIALAAAAAAGLWARLAGFGSRGPAVDEVFFAYAATAIREHGLPRLLDGGFYAVGLIPQYLTALSTALLGESEAALRLPALLGGLALPALAYRYVRGHTAPAVAAAVAIALCLSSWQIEFARFARMYSLFGCAVLLLLTRFDRSLAGQEWGKRYWTHVWALLTVLCHREGALLGPLLFAPLLERGRFATRAELWRYAAVTSGTVAAMALLGAFDFRRFGASGLYPAGYAPPHVSFVRLPAETLWGASPQAALALIALALAAVFVFSRYRSMDEPRTFAALALAAALLHQLALAAAFSFVLLARSAWDGRLARRLALVAACSGGWIVTAAMARMPLSELRSRLFGWPEFVDSIVRPWAQALPWLGAAIAAAAAWSLVREQRPWLAALASPAGVTAYGIACMGLVRYFYDGTRYRFFLYPVLLAAAAVAAERVLGANRAAAAFLAVFALGGDFHPLHIADPAGEAASFRMGRFTGRDALWYPRADYRAAAQQLRARAGDGRTGVVIGTAEPAAYLFDGPFARYLERSEHPFYEHSRRAGTVEMWTGRRLLSTPVELREWSKSYDAVLLVRRYPGDARELDAKKVWGGAAESERVWVSRDGGVDIVRAALPR